MSLLLVNYQWSHIGFMLIRTGPNAVSTKSIKHYKRTLEWQHQVYPSVEEYTLRWSCELWLSKQPRRALCKWECKCTSSVSHSSSMEFYSSCALYTQGTGGLSLWPHCFAPIPTTGTICCCSLVQRLPEAWNTLLNRMAKVVFVLSFQMVELFPLKFIK